MAANEKTLEQQRTECAQIVKSIKAQTTQFENIGKKISDAESKLANIQNDDEEADAQRRALFHRAYLMVKGGTGGYGRKK